MDKERRNNSGTREYKNVKRPCKFAIRIQLLVFSGNSPKCIDSWRSARRDAMSAPRPADAEAAKRDHDKS